MILVCGFGGCEGTFERDVWEGREKFSWRTHDLIMMMFLKTSADAARV